MVDINTDMTAEERIEAVTRTSMKTKDHLKRWIQATGRMWMTFNTSDLVDSLKWPDGIDLLMQVISCYRDHRASIETGRHERQTDPTLGQKVYVPVFKGETLEVDEMESVVRALVEKIREKIPEWTL